MHLVIVNFQKHEFFCRDLADVGEMVQAEILELIPCGATGIGLLVKRALT